MDRSWGDWSVCQSGLGIGFGEDRKPTFDPRENEEPSIANPMRNSSRGHPLEQGMRRRFT